MEKRGVSVIVIAYNEEKNIEECLQTILKSTYSPLELLVVDSSNDRTEEIVRSISDSRIKYISAKYRGYSQQRNIGLSYAKYSTVAFTDADCWVPQDWLTKLVPLIKGNVAGVGGNAYPPKDSYGLGLCVSCLGFPAGGAIGLDGNIPKGGEVLLATCNAVFNKERLILVGGFDETLSYGGEDTVLCRELLSRGYQIRFEPSSFVYHKTRKTFLEFVMWSIRRGKAKAQIVDKPIPMLALNLPVMCGPLMLIAGFVWAGVYIDWLCYFGIAITYIFFALIIFKKSKKFNFLWERRKRIGVSKWQLFMYVPILFVLRKQLMAVGGVMIGFGKNDMRNSDYVKSI